MEKQTKIKELLKRLKGLEDSLPIKDTKSYLDSFVNSETKKFSQSLAENPTVKFYEEINRKLDKFKSDFKLEPIISAIEGIQADLETTKTSYSQESKKNTTETLGKFKEISDSLSKGSQLTQKELKNLSSRIDALQDELSFQSTSSSEGDKSLKQVMEGFETRLDEMFSMFKEEELSKGELISSINTQFEANTGSVKTLSDALETLRQELLAQIANVQGRGGAMNRQMFIGGVDPLTKYTDMNLKAGSNVTISYVNNNTTKKVDVTISSSGGGGGSTRSINNVSTPTAAGDAAGTDYVYLCSGTMTLTLPTAVGNTNLYTVKNVSTGVVTVATTGGETIDDGLTAVLRVQYTAVDLISDGSNWKVT